MKDVIKVDAQYTKRFKSKFFNMVYKGTGEEFEDHKKAGKLYHVLVDYLRKLNHLLKVT